MTEKLAEIYGLAEFAEALGWSTSKLSTYLSRGSAPEPKYRLACGSIWTDEQVEFYKAQKVGIPLFQALPAAEKRKYETVFTGERSYSITDYMRTLDQDSGQRVVLLRWRRDSMGGLDVEDAATGERIAVILPGRVERVEEA